MNGLINNLCTDNHIVKNLWVNKHENASLWFTSSRTWNYKIVSMKHFVVVVVSWSDEIYFLYFKVGEDLDLIYPNLCR